MGAGGEDLRQQGPWGGAGVPFWKRVEGRGCPGVCSASTSPATRAPGSPWTEARGPWAPGGGRQRASLRALSAAGEPARPSPLPSARAYPTPTPRGTDEGGSGLPWPSPPSRLTAEGTRSRVPRDHGRMCRGWPPPWQHGSGTLAPQTPPGAQAGGGPPSPGS